jgi:hypothetical protein
MARSIEIKNMETDDDKGQIVHVTSGDQTHKIKPQKSYTVGVQDGGNVTVSFKPADGYEDPETPYAKTASEVNLPSDTTVGARGFKSDQIAKESESNMAAQRTREVDAERERENREKQLGHPTKDGKSGEENRKDAKYGK